MLLMLDNFDSFTYNLVQYFRELGQEVVVQRNNAITLADIEAMAPDCLVISPGPCTPNEAGISLAAIEHFAGKLPILGICLGHQSIAQVFGGKVIRAKNVMHGKTSAIYHRQTSVFSDLPMPFRATRYHSLVVEQDSLPDCLEVTAWTQNEAGELDEIMGLRHKTLPIAGVQFHPESILTEHGHALLNNFLTAKE
ncbi:aminodeoxychorismate/anthranilate synthase component II [Maribrevibacterium harenarium]|uniref:Aminodeoxychorismate/anthranilate synthase component II n=1 Tax=Maribrevibacterium harenarium TaxID=2589817 RepID=A0A501X3C5_9GAMM|nr:aminodeoxychorismate/anthranilate synthase component II [Maribrevibacterium harenarium]TPE54948.1 aminodeoxychorismate/anthranilate synthase component II [Maribrevibacterium harenarium]